MQVYKCDKETEQVTADPEWPLTIEDVRRLEGIYQCDINPGDRLVTLGRGGATVTFSYYKDGGFLDSYTAWNGRFRRLEERICMEFKPAVSRG